MNHDCLTWNAFEDFCKCFAFCHDLSKQQLHVGNIVIVMHRKIHRLRRSLVSSELTSSAIVPGLISHFAFSSWFNFWRQNYWTSCTANHLEFQTRTLSSIPAIHHPKNVSLLSGDSRWPPWECRRQRQCYLIFWYAALLQQNGANSGQSTQLSPKSQPTNAARSIILPSRQL